MTSPLPTDRVSLDKAIADLTGRLTGMTLDDFRTAQIEEAERVLLRTRNYVEVGSLSFLVFIFVALFCFGWFGADLGAYEFVLVALWAASLGGLGAVASIFLHILNLAPQSKLKIADAFDVRGRIILGSVFSTTFAITLAAPSMLSFFTNIHSILTVNNCNPKTTIDIKDGAITLLPFLSGYSITLVLGLLDKISRGIELTFGINQTSDVVAKPTKPTKS